MSLNLRRLNKVFEESKHSKREIAKLCGFTRPTLDGLLQGADVKISTLVAWAKFFRRPVSYFFDEEVTVRQSGRDYIEQDNSQHSGAEYHAETMSVGGGPAEEDVAVLRERVKSLEALLAEKERLIQVLMKK